MARERKFTIRRPLMVIWAAIVLLSSLLVIAFIFSSEKSIKNPADAIVGTIVFTAIAILLWSITWLSSIKVESESLVIRNMFFITEVPWSQVQDVRLGNGLEIILRDGTELRSIQFGGSLMGALTGYPTYRKSAKRLQWALRDYSREKSNPALIAERSKRFSFPIVDFVFFFLLFAIPAFIRLATL